MKNLIALILVSLILGGCSMSEEGIAKKFNDNIEDEAVSKITASDMQGIIVHDGLSGWKDMFVSDKYQIAAKYNRVEDMVGVLIKIDIDEPFEKLKGAGYEASRTLIKSMDMDMRRYTRNFKHALVNTTWSYTENNKKVNFYNSGSRYLGVEIIEDH